MNLHEYQAKQIFKDYGLPVPKSVLVTSPEKIETALNDAEKTFTSKNWVIKAQVHAGGRGKAGGIVRVSSRKEAGEAIMRLIGKRLVTYQTNTIGQPIHQVLLEEASSIARELYLGAVIDRACQRIVFLASSFGGVEIEEVAAKHPDKIFKVKLCPMLGIMPYQGRQLAFKLGFSNKLVTQFVELLAQCGKLFVESDLSLLEINPLVVTTDLSLVCLDAKIVVDDNALYRQKKLAALRDLTQEDERERKAKEWDLNYISLDGEIGCMVNGAGLAMATMDLIQLQGASPANFLDVGGGATRERVAAAFKIILSDPKVKAVLVNIFGGIVRCDVVADGIVSAIKDVEVKVPVVVRLEGTHAEEGAKLLTQSGLHITPTRTLAEAASRVVNLVKK
ncbi:MAG: ADP-forming succinate--CoA ligase subunit beta [Gammaproteobacteria bacterium]|nr:ADP-forming succinate--CoA ligase subunit beta [Gammaproteobacteria bacterium]